MSSGVYQIIAVACTCTCCPLAQTPLVKAQLSSGLLQPLVPEGKILYKLPCKEFFITTTSFSHITTLEMEQDNFSEGKLKLFSFGMLKPVAIASDETQNSLLQNMDSCPTHAASLF